MIIKKVLSCANTYTIWLERYGYNLNQTPQKIELIAVASDLGEVGGW